jgi:hypothetical protein
MNFGPGARPIYMHRVEGEATVAIRHGDTELTSWPLAGSECPDLTVVDELARLVLTARRAGYTIVLHDPSPTLLGLLDLCGLGPTLRVEMRGQPENLEQPCIEEVVVADDLPVGDLDDLDGPR